jgi:hypothetical protein
MRRFFLVMSLLALVPAGAAAQICVGQPALDDNSSGSVGFGASFNEGGRVVGADATYGGPAFVTASFRHTDYANTELSLKTVGAAFGYDLDGGEGVRICPMASVQYGFGLQLLEGDYTVFHVMPGLGIGMLTNVSSSIDIAPFAQASVVWSRATNEVLPLMADDPIEETTTDTSGLLSFGARAIFNSRLSLGPTLIVPIERAGGDGDVSFGFSLSVGVGG